MISGSLRRASRATAISTLSFLKREGGRRKVNLMSSQAGREVDQDKGGGRLSDMRQRGWIPGKRIEDMNRNVAVNP
jgi:hypothetical protein